MNYRDTEYLMSRAAERARTAAKAAIECIHTEDRDLRIMRLSAVADILESAARYVRFVEKETQP